MTQYLLSGHGVTSFKLHSKSILFLCFFFLSTMFPPPTATFFLSSILPSVHLFSHICQGRDPDIKVLVSKEWERVEIARRAHCRSGLGQRRAGLGCGGCWGRVGLKGFQDTWNIEMVIKDREMSVRLVTSTMGEVGLSNQRVQPAERHRSPPSGREAQTVRIGKVGFRSFTIAVWGWQGHALQSCPPPSPRGTALPRSHFHFIFFSLKKFAYSCEITWENIHVGVCHTKD